MMVATRPCLRVAHDAPRIVKRPRSRPPVINPPRLRSDGVGYHSVNKSDSSTNGNRSLEHGTIPHFKLVYDMVLLLFESKRMRSHELNNNIVIDPCV